MIAMRTVSEPSIKNRILQFCSRERIKVIPYAASALTEPLSDQNIPEKMILGVLTLAARRPSTCRRVWLADSLYRILPCRTE